ncbi:hypothetical protein GFY24_25540 [Nocardia sp. SYP-A9097]|uniref:hypothetical protein n=1 Tax=Nocardia sp. SYP-A9097 TaxID=2663237 RepID=UPI00129A8F43|nr:hypothetical protein [Nocardia sp. SYP-A9097]MRH90762.1 hypothetical protein [Nocardia sp. SYP-A9097]
MLFRATTPEAACDALGVRRSGIRSKSPKPVLCGVVRPEGAYLVVEDRAVGMLEGTWDLTGLSGGREIVAAAEIDGVGHSEVSVWRDGRKVWGIVSPVDDFRPRLSGCVPAEILAELQYEEYLEYIESKGWTDDSDDWEDDFDEVDWFNPILRLAADLTGYVCGSPLAATEEEPFEILESIVASTAV